MKRKIIYRITRKAEGVYTLEERHTFMFFWSFWTKGSIRFRIPSQYRTAALAEQTVREAAARKGRQVFVIDTDGAGLAISAIRRKAAKEGRRRDRKAEERARNLRRIGRDPQGMEAPEE